MAVFPPKGLPAVHLSGPGVGVPTLQERVADYRSFLIGLVEQEHPWASQIQQVGSAQGVSAQGGIAEGIIDVMLGLCHKRSTASRSGGNAAPLQWCRTKLGEALRELSHPVHSWPLEVGRTPAWVEVASRR